MGTEPIHVYYGVVSPYAYLGVPTLERIAARREVPLIYKPADFLEVFRVSGGVPVDQRPAQRQAYRLVELKRWSEYRGLPLNLQPRHFPVDMNPASLLILAAQEFGLPTGALSFALQRALWAQDRDIADPVTLVQVAEDLGLDGASLLQRSRSEVVRRRYVDNTREAIDLGLFGAPSYLYRGEVFWGQDRLDFLDRAIAADLGQGSDAHGIGTMTVQELYSGEDGASHLRDVNLDLTAVEFVADTAKMGISDPLPIEEFALSTMPADWVGDWHPAPRRVLWLILEGEMEIEIGGGVTRRFGPGDILLAGDTSGRGHRTRTLTPVRLALARLPEQSRLSAGRP